MTFNTELVEFDLILRSGLGRVVRHEDQLLPLRSEMRHRLVDAFEHPISLPDYSITVEQEGIVGFEELHSIGVCEDVRWHSGGMNLSMRRGKEGEGEGERERENGKAKDTNFGFASSRRRPGSPLLDFLVHLQAS